MGQPLARRSHCRSDRGLLLLQSSSWHGLGLGLGLRLAIHRMTIRRGVDAAACVDADIRTGMIAKDAGIVAKVQAGSVDGCVETGRHAGCVGTGGGAVFAQLVCVAPDIC